VIVRGNRGRRGSEDHDIMSNSQNLTPSNVILVDFLR
jgi:hypothetical protein